MLLASESPIELVKPPMSFHGLECPLYHPRVLPWAAGEAMAAAICDWKRSAQRVSTPSAMA
jgi:hypothetical protein